MQIVIIGAGNVGAALGKGWAQCGHNIVYGVKDPDDPKYASVKADAGNARMASVAEAASLDGTIVLAVPWDAVPDVLAECGDLGGRVLIDATNPLTFNDAGLSLAIGFSTSGGEEVARLAHGAFVFKTMNQVGYKVMRDAHGYPASPVMFVAGEDADRKPIVLSLVSDLGFNAIDAGPLNRARLLEPYAMLWIDQVIKRGVTDENAFSFMHKEHAK